MNWDAEQERAHHFLSTLDTAHDGLPNYISYHNIPADDRPTDPTDLEKTARRFEPPDYRRFAIHCICCALIYPILLGCIFLANMRSINVVRAIIAAGCMVITLFMTLSLHALARRFIETATWATLIEQNGVAKSRQMKLYDLAEVPSDPTSALSALRLLMVRFRMQVNSHHFRSAWSAYIIFAVSFLGIASSLSFALGRIVTIVPVATFNNRTYTEVPIWSDGVDDPSVPYTFDDVNDMYRNSTILSAAMLEQPAPPEWRFVTPQASIQIFHNKSTNLNHTIFLTNPYSPQLRAVGFTYGVMAANEKGCNEQYRDGACSVGSEKAQKADDPAETRLLQFPQWGARVVCERLPNAAQNIIPGLGSAQVRIPTALPSNLFAQLDLSFPEDTLRSIQPNYGPSLSRGQMYFPNSTPGDSSDPSMLMTINFQWEILDNSSFYTIQDEEGHLVAGYITDRGTEGSGWTIFDITLVRCFTNNFRSGCSNFPLTAPYKSGSEHLVSYDAVACVQRVESWVIEVRNSTLGVGLLDVLERGDSVSGDMSGKEASNLGLIGRRKGNELGEEQGVQKRLSSANKVVSFNMFYITSTYAWLARTGKMGSPNLLDLSYMENTTTNGTISALLFSKFRGVTTATSILPLLNTRIKLTARQFQGEQAATVHILKYPLIPTISLLVIAGALGCLFVPELPKGYPRRRFDMYSWFLAMKGDGLMVGDPVYDGDKGEGEALKNGKILWRPLMALEEVEGNCCKNRVVMLPITNTGDPTV